ncbi:MAG: DUF3050 domain-containing protein [Ectothiorhodospiraceae bacterium]|jgi:hypothetical protein
MYEELEKGQHALTRHRLYGTLDSLPAIRVFMEHHIYAVWDFMTLLKALQRRLTCVELPWRPALADAEAVRFINEIVLGEESDLDAHGRPSSHFEMYLAAMEEVGADTQPVRQFVETLDFSLVPAGVWEFVDHNLRLAAEGTDEEVAAAFLFGREKLIPDMFHQIVAALGPEGARDCPQLLYYLERHIELDGDEHGPLAQRLLDSLIGNDSARRQWALEAGLEALRLRDRLWSITADAISESREEGAEARRA